MAFCLTRRFLGLPAWTWLLLPPLLVLLAYLLGRPGDLSELGERRLTSLASPSASDKTTVKKRLADDDPAGSGAHD
jgi:hypothetical protein